MANYNNLKTAISKVIKTNGNEEITGALLQQSLLAMINALGAGYQFVGIAQPDTLPGAVDYRCFYIAAKAGTYTYFNDIEVEDGELVLLVWDTDWTKQSIVLGVADGAVTEKKIADGSITGDKFSPGLTLYMNKQFTYLKQVQVKYGEDPSAEIKSFAQRDNKTALYVKLSNGLLVPANTNGETVSGLYSYGNTIRKVLFDGTNWSDVEIQNDIIDTAHIKNDAVTTNKIEDSAVTGRKIANSAVLSEKLAQGARNAIILTPDTTEVYEAYYQKLLSEDVDVMFKTNTGTVCTLADKGVYNGELHLFFTNITCNGDVFNTNFYAVRLDIKATWPHSVLVNVLYDDLFSDFLDQSGYLNKSTLTPVLQEIDLTGTDKERKAKLDKFETDWKALTGASDLTGARFVGLYKYGEANVDGIFMYDFENQAWAGIAPQTRDSEILTKAYVDPTDGAITVTPLFSHLEAITIYTDNTAEHMQANIANIAAYEANLQALGVDTDNGIMIPIKFTYESDEISFPYGGFITTYGGYEGFVTSTLAGNYKPRHIFISQADGEEGKVTLEEVVYSSQLDSYTPKSLNAKSFEAIAIKSGNTSEDKVANKAAIKAYVDNLELLSVDVTKGYMIPIKLDNGYHGFIMGADVAGEHTGVIKRGIYNYGGGWIRIDTEGTYQFLEFLTTGSYGGLTTTSQAIVPAINEINALAKGVKAFGAIELKASDNAANKAAITAYLKILTDAQVDITNGYFVPVRITGNSQEYHGMLNIGTGVLLSGVVTDVNENHHYPFNVSTTDGAILFDENNYFLEKGSNEVTEMLDAIKYSYTAVPFTDTTLSNKAQLEVFLSKVPNATVMHCTYKEIWAGTLHKINGDWYGLLVKNTNSPADNINVKLSADGTIVTSNSAQ